MSHCVDPTTLHGFLPNSRFSDLFVKIFHLTAPRKENEDSDVTEVYSDTSEKEQEVQAQISDDVEDGEINDNDDVEELIDDKVLVMVSKTVVNKVSGKSKKALAREKKMMKKKLKLLSVQPGQAGSLTLPLSSQFSLDSSTERVSWLHQLLAFMERRGTPVTSSPSQPQLLSPGPDIPKLPLDLYKLYNTVKEHGGGAACTANQGWREVAGMMELPVQKFFLIKKMYERYLLPFEEAKVREMQELVLQEMTSSITPVPGLASLPSSRQTEGLLGPPPDRSQGRQSVLERLDRKDKRGGGWGRGAMRKTF